MPGDFETEAAARVSFTRDELEALIEKGIEEALHRHREDG